MIFRNRKPELGCPHCLGFEYKLGKLSPAAGEVLVLQVDEGESPFAVERLFAQLRQHAPDVVCLVVAGGIDASIARNVQLEQLQ